MHCLMCKQAFFYSVHPTEPLQFKKKRKFRSELSINHTHHSDIQPCGFLYIYYNIIGCE